MRAVPGPVILAVARYVLSRLALNGPAIIDQLMGELRALPGTGEDSAQEVAKIKRELQRQMGRKDRALEAWLDGAISLEDMRRVTARCEQELSRLRVEAEKLESSRENTQREERGYEEVRAFLERELEGGEAVLDELIERITVRQEDFLVEVAELPVRFQVRAAGEGTGRNYHINIQACTVLSDGEMAGAEKREDTGQINP